MFALGSSMGFPLAGRCAKMKICDLRVSCSQFLQQGLETYTGRIEEKPATTRYKPCTKSEPIVLTTTSKPEIEQSIQNNTHFVTKQQKNDAVETNRMNHYTINIYFNTTIPPPNNNNNNEQQINAIAPSNISQIIPIDLCVDKLTRNIASGSPMIEGFLKNKDFEKDREFIEEKLKSFWTNVFENSKVNDEIRVDKDSNVKSEVTDDNIKDINVNNEMNSKNSLKSDFDYDKIKTYGDYLTINQENENKNVRVDETLRLGKDSETKSEVKLDEHVLKLDLNEKRDDKNYLKAPIPFYERNYDSRIVRPKKIISSAAQIRRKLSQENEETNKRVENLLKLSTQNQPVKENPIVKFINYWRRFFKGEIIEEEREGLKVVDKKVDEEKFLKEQFEKKRLLEEEEKKRVEEEKRVFQHYLRTFQENYRENEENRLKSEGFFSNFKEKFFQNNRFFNKNQQKRNFTTFNTKNINENLLNHKGNSENLKNLENLKYLENLKNSKNLNFPLNPIKTIHRNEVGYNKNNFEKREFSTYKAKSTNESWKSYDKNLKSHDFPPFSIQDSIKTIQREVGNERKSKNSSNLIETFNQPIDLIEKNDFNIPKFVFEPKSKKIVKELEPKKQPEKHQIFFKKYWGDFQKGPVKVNVEVEKVNDGKEREIKLNELKKIQSKIEFGKKNLRLEMESKICICHILKKKKTCLAKEKLLFRHQNTELGIKLKSDVLEKSKGFGECLELKDNGKKSNSSKKKKTFGLIERKNKNQTITFFKRNLSSCCNNKNDCGKTKKSKGSSCSHERCKPPAKKNVRKECIPTRFKLTKRTSCGPKGPLKYPKLKCRKSVEEEEEEEKEKLKKCNFSQKQEVVSTDIDGLYDCKGDKSYERYFGAGGYQNKEYYSYQKNSFYDLMKAISPGRVEQPKFKGMKPR